MRHLAPALLHRVSRCGGNDENRDGREAVEGIRVASTAHANRAVQSLYLSPARQVDLRRVPVGNTRRHPRRTLRPHPTLSRRRRLSLRAPALAHPLSTTRDIRSRACLPHWTRVSVTKPHPYFVSPSLIVARTLPHHRETETPTTSERGTTQWTISPDNQQRVLVVGQCAES